MDRARTMKKPERLTKTRIGNHLRRAKDGDVGMYRNGFKDGVKFAEAYYQIRAVCSESSDANDSGSTQAIAT